VKPFEYIKRSKQCNDSNIFLFLLAGRDKASSKVIKKQQVENAPVEGEDENKIVRQALRV
jgi:hypothetical protein